MSAVVKVEEAVVLLRRARALLREAGALQTHGRVVGALSSADGALRHARRCESSPPARRRAKPGREG